MIKKQSSRIKLDFQLLIPNYEALVYFTIFFCKFRIMNIATSGLWELNYSLTSPLVCVCVCVGRYIHI